MVRSTEAEFRHRRKLREKYFEDPHYRKWSDIAPGGLNGRFYASMHDDCLFDLCLTQTPSKRSLGGVSETFIDNAKSL